MADSARLVHDALGRLYDPVAMQTHALGRMVPGMSGTGAQPAEVGRALRRWLVEGIEQLRPPANVSQTSPAWRAHRLLTLRYVEAMDPAAVQERLGVSKAQYYREQGKALDALVSLLEGQLPDEPGAEPTPLVSEPLVRARTSEVAAAVARGAATHGTHATSETGAPVGLPAALPTGTVTFLFTDVEGSTRLLQAHPEVYRTAVRRHHELLAEAVAATDGVIFETVGDAAYAAFTRATDAVEAALAGQLALQREDWGETPIKVRMGVHMGEAELQGNHYFGAPLYQGGRLMGAAHGGQVVLSAAVTAVVGLALPKESGLLDLGEYRLKDLPRAEHIYQLIHPALPKTFPPLRSEGGLSTDLSLPATQLIGREGDLAALQERLMDPEVRLLTLTGPGGTGKTRMALALAAVMRTSSRFADGVVFVDLAPLRDAGLVVSSIGRALGLEEGAGRAPAAAIAEVLRTRRCLLVLDNFEQVLPAAAEVSTLVNACSGLAVLATSREALRVRGEQVYPLPPLALPESADGGVEAISAAPAVALFLERARTAGADQSFTEADVRAAAEICRRLDGMPLAIELAAARSIVLSPAAMLARLRGWLGLLTRGARDAPERHSTLRAAIAWSHELLSAEEQALFRRLAVFAGGCTLEAAAAICYPDAPPDEIDVLDALTALMDKQLLRRDAVGVRNMSDTAGSGAAGPRFRMLETIREFALEQLEASSEAEAVRDRHAAYFLALAERFEAEIGGPEQTTWFERIDAELDNVRAVLERGANSATDGEAARRVETALRTAAALRLFWSRHGYLPEAVARLDTLVTHPSVGGTNAARARGLYAAGNLGYWLGGMDGQAKPWSEEALHLFRLLGKPAEAANCLRTLAELADRAGDMATAEEQLLESLTLSRDAGDRNGERWSLEDLGDVAAGRGASEEAAGLYDQALGLARAAGDQHSVAAILRSVGALQRDQGKAAAALDTLHEALGIFVGLHDRSCSLYTLEALAHIAAAQGNCLHSTTLLGTAASMRAANGQGWRHEAERQENEATQAALRHALGVAAFEAAWAAGRAMDLQQVGTYVASASSGGAAPGGRDDIRGAGSGTPSGTAGRLTAREREVAALVAQGLSSREIAAQLVIAERTAETHVEHILTKLGFHSRAQVAAWVVEQGLVVGSSA